MNMIPQCVCLLAQALASARHERVRPLSIGHTHTKIGLFCQERTEMIVTISHIHYFIQRAAALEVSR
jgi:hypothetical protein